MNNDSGPEKIRKIVLYHGSDTEKRVEDIEFPGPREDCDFGKGFYMTPDSKVAEEWVKDENSAVINIYELTYSAGQALFLSDTAWLKVVLGYRTMRFNVNISSNLIIGPIADDRMFPMVAAFMRKAPEGISDRILFECLTYVNLGNQYVLKHHPQGLTFKSSYPLKGSSRQHARERFVSRRRNMERDLEAIQRKRYDNEKFLSDYLKECKNGFAV